MKNKKYLTEDIPPKVRLSLYRKALRMLEINPKNTQDKYGYGLCILLRQLLFDVIYHNTYEKNMNIILDKWYYINTQFKLIELTQDRINSINKCMTVDTQTEQRIIVLNEMIDELKQHQNNGK